MARKSKNIFFITLSIILSSILFFVAAEILIRLFHFSGKTSKRTIEKTLCRYDPIIGWKGIPNITARWRIFIDEEEFFETDVLLNKRGFRDYDYDYSKPKGKKRIVVLGDSFAMGYVMSLKDTFSKQLETKLPNYQVINFGIAGYSTDQELLILKTEGLRYEPDIVLLALFMDDILYNNVDYIKECAKPRFFIDDKGELSLINRKLPLIKNRSHFFTFLRKSWFALRAKLALAKFGVDAKLGWFNIFDKKFYGLGGYEITLHLIKEFQKICSLHNAKFIIMIIPCKDQLYRVDFFKSRRLSLALPQHILTNFCKKNDIPYLDLLPLFLKRQEKDRLYFQYDFHWTILGHTIVADEILNFLKYHRFFIET